MNLRLRDAVAVVTGAASGIGRATAVALASRGAHLALTDRDDTGLGETAERAGRAGVRVTTYTMDVTDDEAVAALPARVLDDHGRATVLVNNAGVALAGMFDEVSIDEFRWLLDINLHAVVAHTHAFLAALRREPAAQLVLVSSMFGLIAPPMQVAYATSKFAVRGFGEALRHELEPSSVGVTLVHPGGVATSIALRSRIAAGTDQVEAQRLAKAFNDRFLRISPEVAAERIVRGIERRRRRVLIGSEARAADVLQRLTPTRYWTVLGRGAPLP